MQLPEIESTPSPPARRRGVFYGWWIVGAAVLSQYAYSIQFNANYGVYVYTMGADGKPGGEGPDSDIGNWNIEG